MFASRVSQNDNTSQTRTATVHNKMAASHNQPTVYERNQSQNGRVDSINANNATYRATKVLILAARRACPSVTVFLSPDLSVFAPSPLR